MCKMTIIWLVVGMVSNLSVLTLDDFVCFFSTMSDVFDEYSTQTESYTSQIVSPSKRRAVLNRLLGLGTGATGAIAVD